MRDKRMHDAETAITDVQPANLPFRLTDGFLGELEDRLRAGVGGDFDRVPEITIPPNMLLQMVEELRDARWGLRIMERLVKALGGRVP